MSEYDARRDAALSYDVAIAEMRHRKEWREKLTAAKRVEFIGNCMMIEGDCLTIMPQIGKVDAVVTDPPYGIGAAKMQLGNGRKLYAKGKEWDSAPADISSLPDVPTIIWGGNYFELPPYKAPLVWDKGHGFGVDFADFELAWTNIDMVARRIKFRPMNMDGGKLHPTQKPIDVMKWCLGFLPDAKTILDPFMGSGTTGVACVKTGRHFIGIELDPDYFEIACRRVREAYAQPDLLIDAPKAAPEVQEAFEL